MEQRVNVHAKNPGVYKALSGLSIFLAKSSIERHLLDLIYFRLSQINGCAFCLDMHSKDLRAEGETEQRLHMISAWRESPVYTDRERAAFAWAESVNNLHEGHVPDDVYEEARTEFSEEELIELTMGVVAINSYNRINVAFRTEAGSYTPGAFKTAAV